MKKYIHSLFILLLVISSNESLGNEKEKFVNDLISKMTLEEKVGQMTQINLTVIAKGLHNMEFIIETLWALNKVVRCH